MIRNILTITTVLLAFPIPIMGQFNNSGNPITLTGYVKEMPGTQFNNNFSDAEFSNILHNRLNFRWNISQNIHFAAEGRNRLFYNKMLESFPMAKPFFEQDEGLMDMTWVWLHENAWLGQSMIDRLYIDWRMDSWQVRVGRQRINWGVALVSNPNDLFNTYSFFDFDYPERPGTDAIRIQHFLGNMSRIQLAYSPAKNPKESVGAAMVNLNKWGYDLQTLAGYYRNRLAVGLGWAGYVKGAGFKGEATWFYDLEETDGVERANLVASVGFDYIFPNGTFGVLEFLYNGGYGRDNETVLLLTQPLRADNIMFSEYAITINAQHPFSSILNGGLAIMALPDIEALFISPSATYSVMQNFDLELVGQFFTGTEGNIFDSTGSAVYLSLQYSF